MHQYTTKQLTRFFTKVNKTDTCWLWTGQTFKGYGRVTLSNKGEKAHRVTYRLFKGDIPEGLQIDHLCRVRNCVNPDHLEPVTAAENNRRSRVARGVVKKPYVPHPRVKKIKVAVVKKLKEPRVKKVYIPHPRVKKIKPPKIFIRKGATHCAKGHEYTPDNTYIQVNGCRLCKVCKSEYMKERARLKKVNE